MQLKKLTLPYCQKIINNYSKKFSIAVLKKIKIYGSMILDYAVKMKVIYSNPMKDVLLPKPKDDITSDDKDKYYSKEELKQFLTLVDNEKDIKLTAMFILQVFAKVSYRLLNGLILTLPTMQLI